MLFINTVKNKYRELLFSRVDDRGDVYYFSEKDFPGLKFEAYEFPSEDGTLLRGGFYYYDNPKAGELIIFEHGMGGGHRSYLSEIQLLASRGYLVFSYDHTGCMDSCGQGALGFAHAVSDLNACITALQGEERLCGVAISLIGHSQGGFSVMNVAKYHSDLKAIISISGFISVNAILSDTLKFPLSLFKGPLMSLEAKTSGKYAKDDARSSLTKTNADILIIHSDDDMTVSKKNNFDKLKLALGGRDNISFLVVSGKGHNPNYTMEAVARLAEFNKELSEYRKIKHTDDDNEAFIKKFDFRAMTEQDMDVFEEIFKCLEK